MFKNLQDWIISSEASSKEERSTIIESIGKLISEEASRVGVIPLRNKKLCIKYTNEDMIYSFKKLKVVKGKLNGSLR